jgi:hypothetical protein
MNRMKAYVVTPRCPLCGQLYLDDGSGLCDSCKARQVGIVAGGQGRDAAGMAATVTVLLFVAAVAVVGGLIGGVLVLLCR